MLKMAFELQGKGVGVGKSPPTKASGFITQTKPFHSAGSQEVYSQFSSEQPGLGLGQGAQAPFSDVRESRAGRGSGSSLLPSRMTGCGWTHAWQMAFQRVFRSHLGWVQLLQTMLLTKPEGLLPGRREVKQILSCFSGTACYIKKKNHQADKLGFSTAYNTAFGLSSCKSGQKYLVAISFK